MKYSVRVFVSIKPGVLDPQGKTVNEALHHLGYPNIEHTRIGKYITFDIEGDSDEKIRKEVTEACEKVLTNPIIETFSYDLVKKE